VQRTLSAKNQRRLSAKKDTFTGIDFRVCYKDEAIEWWMLRVNDEDPQKNESVVCESIDEVLRRIKEEVFSDGI